MAGNQLQYSDPSIEFLEDQVDNPLIREEEKTNKP